MRIVSWNVNGLRKLRPLEELFKKLDADIICLQETRISGPSDPELESLAFVPGYDSFFSICKVRGGYSGVATFCRQGIATPTDAGEGLCGSTAGSTIEVPQDLPACECVQVDKCTCQTLSYNAESLALIKSEGRCVVTDHDQFVLVNIYAPAVSVEGRAQFKMHFLRALEAKITALQANARKVVVAGDFNICPAIIDCAEPMTKTKQLLWEQSSTRIWLKQLLASPRCMVDSFREMHPSTTGVYSCWSEATRARQNNHGVRIDLILMDRQLYEQTVFQADVLMHVYGSDHCPVAVTLKPSCSLPSQPAREPPPFCSRFMPRFNLRQKSLKDMLKHNTNAPVSPTSSSEQIVSLNTLQASTRATLIQKTGRIQKHRPKSKQTQSKIANYFHPKAQPLRPQSNTKATSHVHSSSSLTPSSPVQHRRFDYENSTHTESDDILEQIKRREKSANAWRKLLSGPPPPPLCRHGNPSVLKSVSKSGDNKGRTFFSCAYPSGVGKQANCGFFKWAPFKANTRTLPK